MHERTDRAVRRIEGKRLPIGGLVGPDPKQEARRRRRQRVAEEASAQPDLLPELVIAPTAIDEGVARLAHCVATTHCHKICYLC
jgi:hypothetical protein